MSSPVLHQAVVGANPHDAITDHALLMRTWLRELGFQSELYALHIHPALAAEVRPLASYRPSGQTYLIFHHSIGSEAVEMVLGWPVQLILVYHNVTPAEFFEHVDPFWAAQMRLGREQLTALRPRTALALGDSPYNTAELDALGYSHTAVVPITFHAADYDMPNDPVLEAELRRTGPNLLFVGRLAPNKRQEDLVKLLAIYRQLTPTARLHLVGDHWLDSYVNWVVDLAESLGVAEAVLLPGRVSQVQLVTYYRTADLYISMSEHEGFGKPYIESMYLGLPILAYGVTSTPSSLGRTGVQFHHKAYPQLAALVDILVTNHPLRQRLTAAQYQRVADFSEAQAKATFTAALRHIIEI